MAQTKKAMNLTKALIGVALIAPSIVFAQKVDLKLNLKEGKEYKQKTEVENVTKQTMMGQVMEINTSASSTTNMELIQDDGNVDTYDIWYEDVGMSMSGMGQSQSFSSDTSALENVDPMSKVLASLVGKKFQAKITEKGIIEEVMGLEEMVKNSTSGMPGGEAVAEQISASFGDNGLAKNLEMTTDIFPDKSAKVGSSWTKKQFTSTGLPIISNSTYTLISVEDGKATIELSANLETDPENASTTMQGMNATQFYEGDRKGTLTVDVATGWVTSGKIEDDIVGSITLAPNDQIPDGMTVPIEMKNTITISN